MLCMAPTEYRAIAKRTELRALPSLRHAVAAGEPLNPEIVERWQEEVGVAIHDGYGQTETGALTGMPIGQPVRPGLDGQAAARASGSGSTTASCAPTHRPCRRSSSTAPPGTVAHRRPRAARTRTATSGSRAAPTT